MIYGIDGTITDWSSWFGSVTSHYLTAGHSWTGQRISVCTSTYTNGFHGKFTAHGVMHEDILEAEGYRVWSTVSPTRHCELGAKTIRLPTLPASPKTLACTNIEYYCESRHVHDDWKLISCWVLRDSIGPANAGGRDRRCQQAALWSGPSSRPKEDDVV